MFTNIRLPFTTDQFIQGVDMVLDAPSTAISWERQAAHTIRQVLTSPQAKQAYTRAFEDSTLVWAAIATITTLAAQRERVLARQLNPDTFRVMDEVATTVGEILNHWQAGFEEMIDTCFVEPLEDAVEKVPDFRQPSTSEAVVPDGLATPVELAETAPPTISKSQPPMAKEESLALETRSAEPQGEETPKTEPETSIKEEPTAPTTTGTTPPNLSAKQLKALAPNQEFLARQLKQLAKERKIPGYTRMSKAKLMEALNLN